jgi:protein phosphatase
MGGHSSGEVASKLAAQTLVEFYKRTADEDVTWPYKMDRNLSYIENRLVCGIKLANWRVYEAAQKNAQLKGMGTTIVSCLIHQDKAYVAHVGDSRGYRIKSDGTIKQITRDHSLLEDYKEAKPDMTEEEQRNFPHKNVITRALGMRDTVQVDVKCHQIDDGDTFLLCCDGVSGMIEDPKLGQLVREAGGDVERAVGMVIDTANKNGGVDNITAILIRCDN